MENGKHGPADGETLILTSIQKSGTHFLRACLQDIPKRPGMYLRTAQADAMQLERITPGHLNFGHLRPTDAALEKIKGKEYLKVFMYRNFRDNIVSWLYHLEEKEFIYIPGYAGTGLVAYMETDDKLMWIIQNLYPYFIHMMRWMDYADCVIYYDDLLTRPRETLTELSELLNLDLDRMVERSWPRKSITYRRAQPGNWINYFSLNHYTEFKRLWEPILRWDKSI